MENQTLIGVRFGKLVVVEDQGIIPYGKKGLFRRHYLCKCDCGKKVSKARNSLLSNYVKSCGGSCLKSDPEYYGGNYRHGMAGTPIYLGWQAMINRSSGNTVTIITTIVLWITL